MLDLWNRPNFELAPMRVLEFRGNMACAHSRRCPMPLAKLHVAIEARGLHGGSCWSNGRQKRDDDERGR
jgi:hypothetical protein